MKTVVTGGTGFIGSHLVKALLGKGREVIVASNFARLGTENLTDLGLKLPNIEHRTSNIEHQTNLEHRTSNVEHQTDLGLRTSDLGLREVDLTDYQQALKAVDGAEVVYHLAARVGSLEYLHSSQQAELSALQTNLVIDANVFKACLEKGVNTIIYASSCAVYPMHRQSSYDAAFSEDDLNIERRTWNLEPGTIDPDGGYGWAKLLGELQLNWMARSGTINYRTANCQTANLSTNQPASNPRSLAPKIGIARIFNVYGQNEPLGEKAHVVADLIQKAIRYPEEDFIVHGDGKQTRDFLYVSDCVEALLKLEAILSKHRTSDIGHRTLAVNIGSGKATQIGEIARKVASLSNKGITPKFDTGKTIGPLSRTADITRARNLLNWQPSVTLEEGLKRTYDWIEKRFGT